MSWRLTAAVWLLVAPTLAAAQELTAEQVLQRVAEVYATVQDFTASAKANLTLNMLGMVQRESIRQSAVYKRPNKLRLQSTIGVSGGTRTVLCDGRHVYDRQAVTGEYTKKPAPDTLVEIRQLGSDAPEDFSEMVDLPCLLDGADLSTRVREVCLERMGTYLDTPVYILTLALEGGHTERMWVGREDFLIRKLEFRPQATMEPGGANVVFQPLLDMEITWMERYSDIRLSSGVPDDCFRFRLRPGEKRVARLSNVPRPAPPEPELSPLAAPADLTGQVAPDFTLPDLGGKAVTLSELHGKPVLLYFWDSICAVCCVQLPDIQALHEEYGAKGLQVVGVNVDPTLNAAKESAARLGLTFTVLWQDPADPQSTVIDLAYRPDQLPRLLVIDAVGIVRADLTGYQGKEAIVEALKKTGG